MPCATFRFGPRSRCTRSRPTSSAPVTYGRSLLLDPPAWPGHRAGQHVDARLTAKDGYQAQRSYSIASGPEDTGLLLTIERLDDGEVSPYLVDELTSGDELELRGPIGGYFVWERPSGGPLQLIAGGSGVVPFRAMLRHHVASGSDAAVRLLHSARSLDEVRYRQELEFLASDHRIALRTARTRTWPEDWQGHRGRISPGLLREVSWRLLLARAGATPGCRRRRGAARRPGRERCGRTGDPCGR